LPAPDGGGAVLLAAGRGIRFGADKRRARLANGQPILRTTLARYQQAFARVRVVLRSGDDELAGELASDLRPGADAFFVSPNAALGMGHSLADGIAGVDWTYAFVGLADMPFVTVTTLRMLIATMRGAIAADHGPIVQPEYAGERGHPVGFSRAWFSELARLRGDRGARAVLQQHADAVIVVPSLDAGVVADIDTPTVPGLRAPDG